MKHAPGLLFIPPRGTGRATRRVGSPPFVIIRQVKNLLAPVPGSRRVGLSPNRRANYPDWVINNIFGRCRGRGREDYGLRFAPVESIELLEYGAELLLIAARAGEEVETSLGEGRGDGRHATYCARLRLS
jgi:hypothetical protein